MSEIRCDREQAFGSLWRFSSRWRGKAKDASNRRSAKYFNEDDVDEEKSGCWLLKGIAEPVNGGWGYPSQKSFFSLYGRCGVDCSNIAISLREEVKDLEGGIGEAEAFRERLGEGHGRREGEKSSSMDGWGSL